jgi:hypothetical protein
MSELLDDDVVAFTDAPSQDESVSLTKLGEELAEIDLLIARAEKAKERRAELTTKLLPEYMDKIGQDRVGLPKYDVDVVVENYYHASIAREWPDEKRDAAFAELEKQDAGDLIQCNVVVTFQKEDYALAVWLKEKIETLKLPKGSNRILEPRLERAVHWATLTKWVKEQVQAGAAISLEALGATAGRVAKLKKRKS